MKFLLNTILTCLAFGSLGHAQNKKPKKKTQSERKQALSPQEQLKTFELPKGFVIELVASEDNGLVNPIDLAFDDAGRLWTQTARMYPLDPISSKVGSRALEQQNFKDKAFQKVRDFYQLKTPGDDQILVIPDPTKQVEGKIHVFADGVAIPQSLLPYKDGVFVAHGSEMMFFRDTDGDRKSDKVETILSGFGFFDSHTMSHTLVRGPGGWIHFSHGALNKGNVEVVKTGEKVTMNYSKIARFSLAGDRLEIQNAGLNNIWGFHLKDNGQWYGCEANDLNFSLTPLHPMMSYKGIGNDKLRSYQTFPTKFHEFKVGGTGISGLTYDENGDSGFPDKWNNVGFLANPITSKINCVIADRNPDGSVISKHLDDFLICNDDWFRPVNIEFGPDGCLYIVDWYNKIVSHNEVPRTHPERDKSHGRIWRVRHESQKPRAIPNLLEAPTSELVKHLKADILWEKRAAWHQIADRQATELAPQLKTLVLDQSASIPTRIVALWSLESLNEFDFEIHQTLCSDRNPDIRREAVRSLASFRPDLNSVVSLVTPLSKDPHYMVKEQVLRTLEEIGQANNETIKILVEACVPGSKRNDFGNGYEANFQRFLARKALEQYPAELSSFLNSSEAASIPKANQDWAAQAMDVSDRAKAFVQSWNKGSKKLDKETLISASSLLHDNQVFNALKPEFSKTEFVKLAIETQPEIKSSNLQKALAPTLKKLIESPKPEDKKLALNAATKFQNASIVKPLISIVEKMKPNDVNVAIISGLAINPNLSKELLSKIASSDQYSNTIRVKALSKLHLTDPTAAESIADTMVSALSESDLNSVAAQLALSNNGTAILLGLIQEDKISPKALDHLSRQRAVQLHPKHPGSKALRGLVAKTNKQQAADADKKIEQYAQAYEKLEGNLATGKGLFTMCLACHQVGGEGQDIAPALDGSSNRDAHHAITAIVKPDAAIEGGYRLYRLITKGGDLYEGYMYNTNSNGTTLAFMGGGKLFIPSEQIESAKFVNGKSFMPSNFSNFSDQMMVDLVAYLRSL